MKVQLVFELFHAAPLPPVRILQLQKRCELVAPIDTVAVQRLSYWKAHVDHFEHW